MSSGLEDMFYTGENVNEELFEIAVIAMLRKEYNYQTISRRLKFYKDNKMFKEAFKNLEFVSAEICYKVFNFVKNYLNEGILKGDFNKHYFSSSEGLEANRKRLLQASTVYPEFVTKLFDDIHLNIEGMALINYKACDGTESHCYLPEDKVKDIMDIVKDLK
ncbi:MAG: hypothetical protein JW791_04240 [Nanoarchaeota archaeon]|nr:hypothetical protein [Nanoarchaeota archaeon]